MRTKNQIQNNIDAIQTIMVSLEEQMELLEKEYQANAIKALGKRCEEFDKMKTSLKDAWDTLNSLQHMEYDDTMKE
jgi:hypothetical protein